MSFTDLDQGREILSRFSLPKSMKHSVDASIKFIDGSSSKYLNTIFIFTISLFQICYNLMNPLDN